MRFLGIPDYYQRLNTEAEIKRNDIFSLINDKEKTSNKLENVGVNNIVAAFYIKSVQKSRQVEITNNLSKASSSIINNDTNLNDEIKTNQELKLDGEHQADSSNNKIKYPFSNLNSNMFNDKISSDLKMFTDNHLNSVNDLITLIKDKNYEGIIHKDFTSNIKN
jgi:hypothetical protein